MVRHARLAAKLDGSMPLVAFALIAYLAGLLVGFADSGGLFLLVVCAAAAGGARHVRRLAIPFAALATAGIGVARASAAGESRCAAAATEGTLQVVLDDNAAPGAFVRGRLAGCDGRVSMSVERGEATAGATVAAMGEQSHSARGLLIGHASIRVVESPSILRRWRSAAGRSIERTFPADAPLVKALLIADWQELSPEVRDRFAASGLSHILSISGLHIAIIAAAIELALELMGVGRRRAAVMTILVSVFYVALIGAPLPAVRSALMSSTLLLTRLAQRPVSGWAIVAIGAAHPILDPAVVLDAGYQLSVIGVAAVISASQLGKRIGAERLPTVARVVVLALLGTTVATVASAPIVAWIFGRVSIVGPLTNLAANPLVALAQPMIFCGMVLAPIGPLARLIADAAHPLLVGLDQVAMLGAAVPHGAVHVAPTVTSALVSCVMSGAVIVACASREWHRPAAIASAAAIVLIWMPVAPVPASLVELHVIDVGQGDAIALRTAHGHWLLFDAGRAWRGGDAGRSTLIPYLGRRGGPLDLFVLSHPHTDHVGGAASVLRMLRPPMYVDAGFPGGADAYRASLDAARDARIRWVRAHPGDSLAIDGVTVTFLAPDSVWTASLDDPNLASVVALVRVGNVRMLLMGDAERAEEEWLVARNAGALAADILKVGHHGSRTSSSEALLKAVRPRLALVSVGAGNTYHLPTPSVLRALAAHGAQVLRTDHLGTIVARTDGDRIFLEAAGDTWELPPRSPTSSPPPPDR